MSQLSEKLFRAIDRAMQGREFKDEAEYKAFLDSFVGVNIDELAASQELSPADQAMELVDAAREASTQSEALDCLRKAVALDPGCCSAQVGLAHIESKGPRELLHRLDAIIAAEAARLGPDLFKEEKGRFWGVHGTRPYMMACNDRAWLLLETGDLAGAQKAFRLMIQLNRHDNQGVRMVLGPLCLQQGDLKAYRALRNKFKKVGNLELLWGDVLEALLLGESERAQKARVLAREENGFMEAYLLGHRKLPKHMPTSYTWGSTEQAVCAALHLIPAWSAHPTALAWLKARR